MVEKRTEYPWLDAYIESLKHIVYETSRQVSDQAYSGKLDAAVQSYLSDRRDELAEFQYIRQKLTPQDNRIRVAGWHVVAYMVLIAAIVSVVIHLFGG